MWLKTNTVLWKEVQLGVAMNKSTEALWALAVPSNVV